MPEYHYISLRDLASQRDDSKLHNVYGVIKKFQAQGVCLRDETINLLRLDFTSPCEPIIEHIKTGDIMRIHRVRAMNNTSQFLCMKATDFVIFPSFKDKDSPNIAIKCLASNPTLADADYKRFQELESWFSQQLLQVSLSTIKVPGWVDLVCRIIDVKNFGPRSVLIVTDGTKVSSGVKFKWSLRDYESDDEDGILADLVTITVWDKHAIKAKKFRKDDIVVLYNLEVAEPRGMAKNLNGPNDTDRMLDLNLRGGSHHGKCVRRAHKNSVLGISFSRRNSRQATLNHPLPAIGRSERMESNVQRARSVSLSPVLAPSEDQISNASETSISETQPRHSSTMLEDSDKGSSGGIPIRQIITCVGDAGSRAVDKSKRLRPAPEIDFPMFTDVKFPSDFLTIRQYLDRKTSAISCVRARVEILEAVNSKDRSEPVNYIVCVCSKCGSNEPISREQLEYSKRHQSLKCYVCFRASRDEKLALHLKASLTLTDEKTRIKALLSDVDFEMILGLTAADILIDKSASRKFIDFLEFIFPPLINTSRGISDKKFFKWLIHSGDQKNFKIISVKRITESLV